MFVVLYANGAPEEIRTPDPQIRSLVAGGQLEMIVDFIFSINILIEKMK